MNADIENGKEILRKRGVNFSNFKKVLSTMLENAATIDEDYWVLLYNAYASTVGAMGYETIKEWATEFFQIFTEEENSIWLKK